ncbi:MAG TPA: hypothetical protein VFJ54_02645 [Actinomycetota bacterium]|nr:hypothetical protein [Actinomycetota bacterium]
MGTRDLRPSPLEPWDGTDHVPVDPTCRAWGDSWSVPCCFLKGGILTLVGTPFAIPTFAAGLGLMLEPKRRDSR